MPLLSRSDWIGIAIELLAVSASLYFSGPKPATGFLIAGTAILVYLHRRRQEPSIGLSWTDLEARFKELRERDFIHRRSRGDGLLDAVQNPDASPKK